MAANNSFHFRLVKARLAETLIKELFKINGYNVFNFGMETVMPMITGTLNKDSSTEALDIRQMPDFVVQRTSDGALFYVEVKYRANGKFSRAELPQDFRYQNAWFIIVSRETVQCASFNQLDKGIQMTGSDQTLLEHVNPFELSLESIEEFKSYGQMFFNGVS